MVCKKSITFSLTFRPQKECMGYSILTLRKVNCISKWGQTHKSMEYITNIRHKEYRPTKMWMYCNSLRTLGLIGESLMDQYGALNCICIYWRSCQDLELEEAAVHEYIRNAQWQNLDNGSLWKNWRRNQLGW
jgi:hypothetical protein